jgi:hypothetical protein
LRKFTSIYPSKLGDDYLRNNQPADYIVLEQNKICLELAEAALEKIDWNKYKQSQAKRLVFIFNMTFKIFLLILLTSVAGIVAQIFVGNSTTNAITESNTSALKNETILENETIRLPPNHSAAETKTLNQLTSAGRTRKYQSRTTKNSCC